MYLKFHLRFRFKKYKHLQTNVKEKMHLTLQLMVHLTMQSRVHLWISDSALYVSFTSCIAQNIQNCWHIKLGSISKVHIQVKKGGRGRSGQNRNLLLFFFSKCVQRRFRIKTNWLISAYVLYRWHLIKKSTTKIYDIS